MKITFIGGGNMAEAIIGGLLEKGFSSRDIAVVERLPEQRQKLMKAHGVSCFAEPEGFLQESDMIILAVKPQQMSAATAGLSSFLHAQIVLSIAAGLTLKTLSRYLGGYSRIIRAMPNTPAMIGAGITGLCALPEVVLNERLVAERVLESIGETLWVENETMMDAVTAISGSGPAYLFLFIEALEKAAAEQGFSPEKARCLAVETTLGASRLAARSSETPAALREKVTSKGGTTEAALKVMAEKGVAAGIIAGIQAAASRSRELAKQLDAITPAADSA